jgi:LPS-assembly lipoprotein
MKQFNFLLLCLAFFSLTACGFHVRNQANLPPELKTLNVTSFDTHSNIAPLLIENLKQLGVTITPNAPNTLAIVSENFSQSRSILGTAQQLNSVNLYYTVTYKLNNAQTTLTTSVTYLQNANQILGDTTMIPSLQQNLLRTMVQQILSHLSADNTRHALSH